MLFLIYLVFIIQLIGIHSQTSHDYFHRCNGSLSTNDGQLECLHLRNFGKLELCESKDETQTCFLANRTRCNNSSECHDDFFCALFTPRFGGYASYCTPCQFQKKRVGNDDVHTSDLIPNERSFSCSQAFEATHNNTIYVPPIPYSSHTSWFRPCKHRDNCDGHLSCLRLTSTGNLDDDCGAADNCFCASSEKCGDQGSLECAYGTECVRFEVETKQDDERRYCIPCDSLNNTYPRPLRVDNFSHCTTVLGRMQKSSPTAPMFSPSPSNTVLKEPPSPSAIPTSMANFSEQNTSADHPSSFEKVGITIGVISGVITVVVGVYQIYMYTKKKQKYSHEAFLDTMEED